jgi:hypothetical protein
MPASKLNNLEYLALQMLIRPGQSGRFYLRKLHQYRFPIEHKTNPKSNFGALYFAPSGRYFGKLWVDEAKCTVRFYSFSARGKRQSVGDHLTYLRPIKSQWHLTPAGLEKALNAAAKIGLSESEINRLLETPAPSAARSKKQQLLDWWKVQPDFKATRVALCRQYEIISGWRNEDGSLTEFGKNPLSPTRYTSLTAGNVIRSCGFKDHLKVLNPATGRMVQVINLDFKYRV